MEEEKHEERHYGHVMKDGRKKERREAFRFNKRGRKEKKQKKEDSWHRNE